MLKLTFAREPVWLDLVPGVRIHVRPATSLVFTAAGESMVWVPIDGLPTESVLRVAFVKAVTKAAILAWEGVGVAARRSRRWYSARQTQLLQRFNSPPVRSMAQTAGWVRRIHGVRGVGTKWSWNQIPPRIAAK